MKSLKVRQAAAMLIITGSLSTVAAVADAVTKDSSGLSEISISTGALIDKRKQLLEKIKTAKSKGVGVAPYLSAFTDLNSQLESGKQPPNVESRVDSISKSLDEQLARIEHLKNRVIPAARASSASAATAVTPGAGSSEAAAPAGKNVDLELVRKLMKEQYGQEVPQGVSNAQLNKLIESDPKIRDMWQGIKGKTVVNGQ